jgi:hypothetical protein
MAKLTTSLLSLLALLALALTMFAQTKAGKSKILQPQMTVAADGGTYKQPMGKLGEKSADPWSATTLGASVDGKPNPGAVKTVVGEIVDFEPPVATHEAPDQDRAHWRAARPLVRAPSAARDVALLGVRHQEPVPMRLFGEGFQ